MTGVDVTIEPSESAESPINNDLNLENTVVLDVDLRNSNYTATNAEGEVLTITDGLIGGTMPILERWFLESATIRQSNVQLMGDKMEYLVRYSFAPEVSYKAHLSGNAETFVLFETP